MAYFCPLGRPSSYNYTYQDGTQINLKDQVYIDGNDVMYVVTSGRGIDKKDPVVGLSSLVHGVPDTRCHVSLLVNATYLPPRDE